MENVISIHSLKKTFRDFWLRPTVTAVDGIDFDVGKGEVFGLLGPNGSGKSTTIKLILGLLSPTAGKIEVFGSSPRSLKVKARLGYLSFPTSIRSSPPARRSGTMRGFPGCLPPIRRGAPRS